MVYAAVDGVSMMDIAEKVGYTHSAPLAFDWVGNRTCVHRDTKGFLIGPGDYSGTEVKEYLNTLVRFNGRSIYNSSKHCACCEIPITYIHCPNDAMVVYNYQQYFSEETKKAGLTV